MKICHKQQEEMWNLMPVKNRILIRADTSGHPSPDEILEIEYFYAPKTLQLSVAGEANMCQKFKTIKKSSGKFSQLADLIYVSS